MYKRQVRDKKWEVGETRCAQTTPTSFSIFCPAQTASAQWNTKQSLDELRELLRYSRLLLLTFRIWRCQGKRWSDGSNGANMSERSELVCDAGWLSLDLGTRAAGNDSCGRLLLLTFLGEARKVSSRRATPGNALLHGERTASTHANHQPIKKDGHNEMSALLIPQRLHA